MPGQDNTWGHANNGTAILTVAESAIIALGLVEVYNIP
jgi:hypothetical protein